MCHIAEPDFFSKRSQLPRIVIAALIKAYSLDLYSL